MSRDSESDDDHYEEESMMNHIDYNNSTSMNDMMEHYIDNGSSCMEDMEVQTKIFFPCMEAMELYTDNGSTCMDEDYDGDSLEDHHEYLPHMELDDYLAMQEEAHHQQSMTSPKTRGTYYDGTSSRPRYSPSS